MGQNLALFHYGMGQIFTLFQQEILVLGY